MEVEDEESKETDMSLPLWERGLKFRCRIQIRPVSLVAPLVGAWIEIYFYLGYFLFLAVAPLVGAWIEITSYEVVFFHFRVAPLVGAWIEMLCTLCTSLLLQSLPLWERGLKLL